jgi:hypothetical protein
MSAAGASATLISIPTSKPKNTPARALNFFFGVRISRKKTNTARPRPLQITAQKLGEFSSFEIISELAFTNNTPIIMKKKITLNIQINMAVNLHKI